MSQDIFSTQATVFDSDALHRRPDADAQSESESGAAALPAGADGADGVRRPAQRQRNPAGHLEDDYVGHGTEKSGRSESEHLLFCKVFLILQTSAPGLRAEVTT